MTEAPDPRIGTTLDGRYRITERLAAGGMGVVYKGELTAIGKPVAIKFLHDALTLVPDVVRRFQREATAMSKLAHPNLVGVLDSGIAGGVPYLVMDYVHGKSLAEVLASGAMPATRAAGLARQILAGVRHAHASHVVHRDLKPDNILLLDGVEGDFVKILDFGLAKVLRGEDSAAAQLTNTGFAMGTPGYMSPEQARGTEADERSDLYGVGVILYHMVTGRKPFIADSPIAVLRMHMDDAPMPPTQLLPRCCSSDLERVILRAMAKEPGARWQTAGEFAQALMATPEGREAAGGGGGPVSEEWSSPRRRAPGREGDGPGIIGIAVRAVIVVAVMAAVALSWSQLSRHSQQKVKRKIDDVAKLANEAFESAKEGAQEMTKAPPAKKGAPAVAKKEVPPPVAKKEEPPPPVAKKEEPPPPVAKKEESPPPAIASKTAPPDLGAASAQADDDDEDDDTIEEPAPPSDTPGAKLEEQQARAAPPLTTPTVTKESPKGPSTKEARAQLAAGKYDAAIKTLYAVRRTAHGSAEVALLLGHAYFKKLWRTDGLREYDTALKMMPSLRNNGALVRDTVSALDGPTHHLAYSIIWMRIGKPALPHVRLMARTAKSVRTRARAAHLAQQLAHSRRR